MRTKNFKQSCKQLGIDPNNTLPDVSNMPEELRDIVTAFSEMLINTKALRQTEVPDYKPDYQNKSEAKYSEYFDLNKADKNPTGFRFWLAYYVDASAYAPGGAALCLPTSELSEYRGKTFKTTWQRVLKPKGKK